MERLRKFLSKSFKKSLPELLILRSVLTMEKAILSGNDIKLIYIYSDLNFLLHAVRVYCSNDLFTRLKKQGFKVHRKRWDAALG